MRSPLNVASALGIALGAVFGMAGTIVSQEQLRSAFWAIDGVGLVVATALLTIKFSRQGNDCVAAGFLVFAIGEAVMLPGTAAGLAASVPSFAAGTALWSAGLLLTSIPAEFPVAVRIAGLAAAALFAITSGRIFWGEQILPISSPLPFFAYPVLVLTFLGWIWSLLRDAAIPLPGRAASR